MLAHSTGQVARFIVFGSFVTAKPAPGDVDIFLLMEDSFDVTQVHGEAALVFDPQKTQEIFGASVFWIRKQGAITSEQEAVEDWQFIVESENKFTVRHGTNLPPPLARIVSSPLR